MMGVGAMEDDAKAMLFSGFEGLVFGACSMAIGQFVSVYSQLDIEVTQMKREQMIKGGGEKDEDGLPSPVRVAAASTVAFSAGAMVSILTAGFISSLAVKFGVVLAVATVALVVFGSVGALLGRAPVARSAVRALVGGWMAMVFTFAVMKIFGSLY